MKKTNRLSLNFVLNNEVFRLSLLGLIYISVIVSNIYLVEGGYLKWSLCTLFVFSLFISMLTVHHINDKNSPKIEQLTKNVAEAQKLLRTSDYGLFKYGRVNLSNSNDISFIEIMTDPVSWCFCLALFFCFFFTSTYLEFELNDLSKILKLIFLTILQVILLSFVISGILIVFIKKKDK